MKYFDYLYFYLTNNLSPKFVTVNFIVKSISRSRIEKKQKDRQPINKLVDADNLCHCNLRYHLYMLLAPITKGYKSAL